GVDLVEVASAVVATTSRPAADASDGTRSVFDSARYLASPPVPASGQPPGPPPTAEPIEDLAATLAEQLVDLVGPVALALLSREEDGSLQIVGSVGLPPGVVAAWQRVAPQLNTPVAVCARTGEEIWLPDLPGAPTRHVLIVDPEVMWPSRFVLPVRRDGQVVAVIAVVCETAQPFDPATRRAVTDVASHAGARLSELLLTHPRKAGWIGDVQAILDIVPGAVAVNVPVRDASGRVVDYLVVAASPEAVDIAGRRGRELVGTSTVDLYRSVVGTELWHAYEQVLATGRPREIGPFTYTETAEGIDAEGLFTVRANRLGSGLMVSWVRHDDQRRYAARLAQTERLGNLGWAEWDLRTNTVYWSEGMFAIYERHPADGPYTLEEAGALVHPDDVDRAGKAVVAMLEDGQPMDIAYRIRLPSGSKHVRAMFETSRDAKGRPLKAYGIVQDVTAAENAERDRVRLADIEAELAERQRSLQTEHRLVTALQQIILPLPVGTIALPGLRVAVRYQPAEELTRVGGDWYDLVELPSGRTLLAVGDVA
ncbi:MAG TPA: GAF domain-containing protein, partial [Micromonosporaceae bacterium]|nr:GAF domain-containing protein [Micromonosporaceae bacterium]